MIPVNIMNANAAVLDSPEALLKRLEEEQLFVQKKWLSLFWLFIFNALVSIYLHVAELSPQESTDVSSIFTEQVAGYFIEFLVIYFCIKYQLIKRFSVRWAVFCMLLYAAAYAYDANDLFESYSSGRYEFPTNSLAFIAVIYDQLIARGAVFFLTLTMIGSVISLRHQLSELWLKRDTLLKGVSQELLAKYSIKDPQKIKKGFLAECFKRHSLDEAEQLLIVGTSTTTPPFDMGMSQVPRPWLFVWVFIRCLVVYGVLLLCWYQFQNHLILPGLIVVGSFLTPFALLILFYELNTPKNISFAKVIQLTLIGGVLAILISLVMYEVLPTLFPDLRLLGSSKAGIVEEVGKLVGLIILLNALPEVAFKYRLNALLIGAAVGAGFDAFESAGYAFDTFLFTSPSKFSQIISNKTVLNIHMRGILAPFTHMVWTAIAASAYWQAKKRHGTTVAALTSWHFLKLFLIAVVLHMAWDFETDYDLLKILVLCIIAYVLTSKLIRLGFKELEAVPADAPLKATS